MQDPEEPGTVRPDLLERLKALDTENGSGSLAELAYRRAREALERALEEARSIRLQALDDARRTREDEARALYQALQSQKATAESEAQAVVRRAELEAEAIRSRARRDADQIVRSAEDEAAGMRADAARTLEESRDLRDAVEERGRRMDRLEAEFDQAAAQILERLGLTEKPVRGWWRRITQRGDATPGD